MYSTVLVTGRAPAGSELYSYRYKAIPIALAIADTQYVTDRLRGSPPLAGSAARGRGEPVARLAVGRERARVF